MSRQTRWRSVVSKILLLLGCQAIILSFVISSRNYTTLLLTPLEGASRLSDYRRFKCLSKQLEQRLPEGSLFRIQATTYYWEQRLAELAFPWAWASTDDSVWPRVSLLDAQQDATARTEALARDSDAQECFGAWLVVEANQQ